MLVGVKARLSRHHGCSVAVYERGVEEGAGYY